MKEKAKKHKYYFNWNDGKFYDKDGKLESVYYDNAEVNVLIRKPPKYPFRPFRKRRYKDGDRVVLLVDMFGFKKGDVGTVTGRAISKKGFIVVIDYEYLSKKRKKAIDEGIIPSVGLEISSKGIKPYK